MISKPVDSPPTDLSRVVTSSIASPALATPGAMASIAATPPSQIPGKLPPFSPPTKSPWPNPLSSTPLMTPKVGRLQSHQQPSIMSKMIRSTTTTNLVKEEVKITQQTRGHSGDLSDQPTSPVSPDSREQHVSALFAQMAQKLTDRDLSYIPQDGSQGSREVMSEEEGSTQEYTRLV